MSLYLYCIINNKDLSVQGYTGVDDLPIKKFSHGDLAILYSECEQSQIMPSRKNMVNHQKIGEDLIHKTAVIPMKYGVFVDDKEALEEIMTRNYTSIEQEMAYLDGKIEYTLRVTFLEPDIFNKINATYEQIGNLREQLNTENGVSYNERVELGKLVEQALNKEAEKVVAKIDKLALSDVTYDSADISALSDLNIFSRVYLLDDDHYDEFENRITPLSESMDICKFQLIGPEPAVHFVDLNMEES